MTTAPSDQVQTPPVTPRQPWTSFPQLSYQFINKDFVHDSHLAFKLNLSTARGGATIKQSVTQTKTGSHLADETKFWFALPQGRSLFAKLTSGQHIKLHYDNGTTSLLQKSFNLYTTVNFQRKLNHIRWGFGLLHSQDGLNIDNRLKIDNQGSSYASYYTRTLYTWNKLSFGFMAACDISKRILTQNSLLFGYDFDEKTTFLVRAQSEDFRHSNPQNWKHVFDHLVLNAISKYNNKTKLGFQFALQPRGRPFKEASLVAQRQINDDISSKFKLKVSGRVQLNFLVKFPVPFDKQHGNISLGLHSLNIHQDNREFKWGSQIQYNL